METPAELFLGDAGNRPVRVDRETDAPRVVLINTRGTGLDEASLACLGVDFEYAELGQAPSTAAAVALVYFDEFNQQVRDALSSWQPLPVVGITGTADIEAVVWALRSGVTDIVCIPGELEHLRRLLEGLCPRGQEQRRAAVSVRQVKRTSVAVQTIMERYGERLTVPQLASLCNMTAITFLRTFKRENGSTVVAYVNRFRVERSKVLLAGSGKSIKEIATDCGFDDISYFSRVFRKIEGTTPTRFRARNRSKKLFEDFKSERIERL